MHLVVPALALAAPLAAPQEPATQDAWVRAARAAEGHHSVAASFPLDPADTELAGELRTLRVPPGSLDKVEDLREVVALLRAAVPVNIVLDPLARLRAFDSGTRLSFQWDSPVPLGECLDRLLIPLGPEFAWQVRSGAVLITTAERARGERLVHPFVVADLVADGIGLENLAQLIQANIQPESWSSDGVSMELHAPLMIVAHERAALLAIETFLHDLRADRFGEAEEPAPAPVAPAAKSARTLPRPPLSGRRIVAPRIENEESLTRVMGALSALCGVPIDVHPQAEAEVLDLGIVFDADWPHPMELRDVLDALCAMTDGAVSWMTEGPVVRVGTFESLYATPVERSHRISDLVQLGVAAEDLAFLLMDRVAPASWHADGVGLEPRGDELLVYNALGVQEEITRQLDTERRWRAAVAKGETYAPWPSEARYLEVRAQLAQAPVTLSADAGGGPLLLDSVLDQLQSASGVNMQISAQVRDELDASAMLVDLELPRTTVRNALDLLEATRPEIAWSIVHGLVLIRLRESPVGGAFTARYDVGDWLMHTPTLGLDAGTLEEWVRNHVAPESWDMDPVNSFAVAQNGELRITQSAEAQGAVRALLQRLAGLSRTLQEALGQR